MFGLYSGWPAISIPGTGFLRTFTEFWDLKMAIVTAPFFTSAAFFP